MVLGPLEFPASLKSRWCGWELSRLFLISVKNKWRACSGGLDPPPQAHVAELVDALGLGSSDLCRGGSSPLMCIQ
jgi:hypothetical protein